MSTRTIIRPPGLDPARWAWYEAFGGEPALPPHVRARNRRIARKAWIKAGASAAAASAAVAGSVQLSLLGLIHPLLTVLAAHAAVVGLPLYFVSLGSRAVSARRRSTAAATRAAYADRIHGTPGRGPDSTPSGSGSPGGSPARATAALLEMLVAIPGTAVFHGLRGPWHEDGFADHAVACGSAVFLLDSALFRGGTCEWAPGPYDVVVRTEGAGLPRPQTLHEAADELRLHLGPEIEVVPILVVHGASTSPGSRGLSPHGVHLLTAAAAMERIGNACAFGFAGCHEDPRVREVLNNRLA